jgi:hypothetical protein
LIAKPPDRPTASTEKRALSFGVLFALIAPV